jgi:hypothetical protein
MKKFALLSTAAIAVLALGACTTTQKKDCCGTCGGKCSEKASMGTVGGTECSKSCSGEKASMGAVSTEKACTKSCGSK